MCLILSLSKKTLPCLYHRLAVLRLLMKSKMVCVGGGTHCQDTAWLQKVLLCEFISQGTTMFPCHTLCVLLLQLIFFSANFNAFASEWWRVPACSRKKDGKKKDISFAHSLSLFADTADPALLLGLECTLYNRCS